MKSLTIASLFAALSLLLFAGTVWAASRTPPRVAVWVEVSRPSGATDERLKAGFEAALPTYAALDGLERKYFTMTDTAIGGVYVWRNRSAAEAYFNAAWQTRIRQTYGQDAKLVWFVVPEATTGASLALPSSSNVVAIVSVRAPWYASNGIISSRFTKSIPTYAAVPNLIFKYFTLGPNRTFGGIYLWEDQASADAYYNAAWHDRITRTYKQDGNVVFLKAPVTLINARAIR
jgi:hypothetical protein